MYDEVWRLIADSTDAHVTFEPVDEKADDPYSVKGEESIVLILGHVVVHLTASMEKSASIASELARGVPYHGRRAGKSPGGTQPKSNSVVLVWRNLSLCVLQVWICGLSHLTQRILMLLLKGLCRTPVFRALFLGSNMHRIISVILWRLCVRLK